MNVFVDLACVILLVLFFYLTSPQAQVLEAVHMSRASPANRADSILSRPMVA